MDTDILTKTMQAGQTIITSPMVQGVVSSLITTLFLRRGENIKAFEAIKARQFEKVTSELLDSGRLSYVEYYKCKNFLKIAKYADEVIRDYEKQNFESKQSLYEEEERFSFDWLMRFFDAVGNISNEELQILWGKILANEISRPKSCSLRTLDMIRNMSSEEAKTFSVLCRYIMQSGNSYYIDSAGFLDEEDGDQACCEYMKRQGFSYGEHIVPLIEAGVFSIDNDLAIHLSKNYSLEIHNDKICGVVMGSNEAPILLQRAAYFLTTSGKELFQVLHESDEYETDEEYVLLCLKQIKRENNHFYVGAYYIEGKENLLED